MTDKIRQYIAEAEAFHAQTREELEAFRIRFLGKKGLLNDFFAEFRNVPAELKKEFGQVINQLKQTAEAKVRDLQEHFENTESAAAQLGDLTRPGEAYEIGARHPISIVKNQIVDIFSNIGFNVSGNNYVDPYSADGAAACIRVLGTDNRGYIGGETFRYTDPSLGTYVADYSIYVDNTSGNDIAVGRNQYGGIASGKLGIAGAGLSSCYLASAWSSSGSSSLAMLVTRLHRVCRKRRRAIR